MRNRTHTIGKSLLFLVLLLCITGTFSGCQAQSPLSQRLLIQGVGIDWSEEEGYTAILQVNEVEDGLGNEISLYTAQGSSVLEALRNVTTQNGKIPLYFHDLTVVYGKEAARHGLGHMLDFFLRNPEVPSASMLLVCEGSALEILSAQHGEKMIAAQQLGDAVDAGTYNGKTAAVDTTILLNHISGEGASAYLPVVRLEEETPTISGTAVLNREGKLIDVLDDQQTMGMLLVMDRLEGGYFTVHLEDTDVSVEISGCSTEILIEERDEKLVFKVQASCSLNIGALNGSTWNQYGNDYYAKIEEGAREILKKDAQSAIETCIFENEADIFQFGRWLHKKDPQLWGQWEDDWQSKMQDCIYEVEVETEVQRVGKEVTPSIE